MSDKVKIYSPVEKFLFIATTYECCLEHQESGNSRLHANNAKNVIFGIFMRFYEK